MGRLMDCMSSGRLVGARGCCCEKETIAQCAYAAGQTAKTCAWAWATPFIGLFADVKAVP